MILSNGSLIKTKCKTSLSFQIISRVLLSFRLDSTSSLLYRRKTFLLQFATSTTSILLVIVTTFLLVTSSPNHIVFVLSFVLTYSFLFLFFLRYNITLLVYFRRYVHFIHNPQPYYYQCSYYYFYHNPNFEPKKNKPNISIAITHAADILIPIVNCIMLIIFCLSFFFILYSIVGSPYGISS